ncbi:MAG: HAD family hydrolase, partial [Desulfobacterales bacterium]
MSFVKVKLCIFDVNGVLIDSNLANAQAMARAFTDDPIVQKRIADLYLKLTGIDRGSKIRIIQEQVISRPFNQNEFDLRWEGFHSLSHQSMLKAPLLPGCKEILDEIGTLDITRAALSNTPLAELQEILAAHNLETLLDIVRGGGNWPKSESLVRLIQEFQ